MASVFNCSKTRWQVADLLSLIYFPCSNMVQILIFSCGCLVLGCMILFCSFPIDIFLCRYHFWISFSGEKTLVRIGTFGVSSAMLSSGGLQMFVMSLEVFHLVFTSLENNAVEICGVNHLAHKDGSESLCSSCDALRVRTGW